jgi:alkyl sulfatase BDS1-like metallo-beta-lactamase superfamily hydrolase
MINPKDFKRKIITFCGSTRFHELFHELAEEYTKMGWIVLMPHCYYTNGERPDLKDLLVDIHRDMITMSDAVLIVNKDGYIGESTAEEIKFAKALNKEIKYYETPVESTK